MIVFSEDFDRQGTSEFGRVRRVEFDVEETGRTRLQSKRVGSDADARARDDDPSDPDGLGSLVTNGQPIVRMLSRPEFSEPET